ncbi:hypothetical protein KOR34_22100 [Posidoniimonas corsicana]|uniref:DUF1559 domain-containing protein n=2 Tax=Posidoniimonas corsicana TaxID=1938618 RepID=A0A5C5VGZ4_9BACT|nr:hypothetical protein KOR34_22100 [Posidoniimonas corsicana]
MSKLKMLVLSLHNYHDTHGNFPPAFTADSQGQPLHSWRTLILPYLEEMPLYSKLNFDEPWNSSANARWLNDQELHIYRSPQRPESSIADETHYFSIVDDETLLRPGGGVSFRDIADGSSNTIALIEAAGRGVRWHEPRDLSMDEAIDLLVGESDETHEWVEPGFFISTHYRGDGLYPRNVAFADGRVRSIGYVPTRELARAALTRAGGEEIPAEIDSGEYNRTKTVVGYTVHWRRVLSTTLFVGLAVGPFLRRRNPLEATGVEEVNHEDTKQLVSRSTSHS